MQKQSACIKYKSNLFKPCKWLCAFGQEKTRTLRSKQYTMIFSHIKRKKFQSPTKQFKELFILCPNHFRWNGIFVSEV